MRTDNPIIAEAMLVAEGFLGKDIAHKLCELYGLSRKLDQQHYDWGLRAMKAVLGPTVGKLLQSAK